MSAIDGLATSTNKPLPMLPSVVDPIRRRMRWLYFHPRFQKLEGYHFGILCCAAVSATTMAINLTLTIWAFKHYEIEEGVGTILDGSCSETKKLAIWPHLGINVLSTLLLGASNYTMQCLCSPTREDIDRAHSQDVWLNIGTPSIRNLLAISRSRMLLWWPVAISSVPLPLMYNSAIFTTLSAREYYAYLVHPEFLTGASFNITAFTGSSSQVDVHDMSGALNQAEAIAHDLRNGQRSLQNLTNVDCIWTYAAEFVSSHANVLAVSSDSWSANRPNSDGNSILQVWRSQTHGATNESPWFCGDELRNCILSEMNAEAATWQLGGWSVEYCLGQPVEEHCKLQFSGAIMVVVIVCNLCKMIIMGYVAWIRPSEPLVTVGDAIASFLDQPDPTTIGMCLAGRDQFGKMSLSRPASDPGLSNWGEGTMRYNLRASSWGRAVSMRRWTFLSVLCAINAIIIGILFNKGLQKLPSKSMSYVWSLGLGRVTSTSLLHLPHKSLILTILLANSPQIVLSCFYVTLNGILTSMLLANELNGYAHQRKTLRVTSPTGKQRSTYRLHIPYTYGVPLLVMFGILHWLVSQSFFLTPVTMYDTDGSVDVLKFTSTCGYSLVAIFFALIIIIIIVWFVAMIGCLMFKPGMPLIGSCSAAISAACHPSEDDKDASKLPVKWGAVGHKTVDKTGRMVGHCTFTSFKVKALMKGEFYAGHKTFQ